MIDSLVNEVVVSDHAIATARVFEWPAVVMFSFQFCQEAVQCGGDEAVGAGDPGDQVGVVGEPRGSEDPLVQGDRHGDADLDPGAGVIGSSSPCVG